MKIPFDNTYAQLPDRFFSRQEPAPVPAPELIRVNDDLALHLGLDAAWLGSSEGVAVLSGNVVPEGAEPLAQAYAGHQFGGFVPQLGDGRAILLGELLDQDGQRRDLQLKGSGRTMFSRNGDGKSALGPVLREYIVSEAMTALGIPSTRALAAVTTGEVVQREAPFPGAILTRVAASHLRVGTFQYFAAREDTEALQLLVDTAIKRHYPNAHTALDLLNGVIAAQSELVASWMLFGFIHGVMNTDNVAVSGETIDFGPCAFMDAFHPNCVFSAIDQQARYAWGNQPSICKWNLTRFAETLLPLMADTPEEAVPFAEQALSTFGEQFETRFVDGFLAKLGLAPESEPTFINTTLETMAEEEVDFTLFFRHLTTVAAGTDPDAFLSLFKRRDHGASWLADWRAIAGAEPLVAEMQAANPILIPRNHRVEEAIQHAYSGDYTSFHRLVDALAKPYEDQVDYRDLEAAPLAHERVTQTFCGT